MRFLNSFRTTVKIVFLTAVFGLLGESVFADPIIYESATMGAAGQTNGWGLSWEQFIGSRFYVNQQVEVTAIGGHLTEWTAGNLFGAIIALTGPDDLPDGSPFYSPEVVASTVFDPGYPSSDFRTPLAVTLQPGYYALVFGTYELGASNGEGAMPYGGQVDLPGASYFIWAYDLYWGWGWYNTLPTQARFVVEGIPGYCGASGGCGYEYIKDVVVGDINNTGTGCDNYADYTSLSTAMEIGTGYTITVTNGDPYDEDQCGIWVDWNQDKDFDDPDETIIVTGNPGGGPYTATITPPADANLGDTRMRVRLMYTGALSPCGTTTYGEVEDYMVTVASAGLNYCAASGGGDYEYISGVEVGDISNTGTGCDGYADYTSLSTTMEIGSGYVITVTNGEPYDEDQCGIWVDWNQDKDFDDPGETIPVSGSPGVGPYYATITPVVDANLGDTRMRIRIMWTGALSPCGTTGYGEVEDYTINVYTTTMRLEPIADAYVTWDDPNTNYGTETKLRVGKKDYARYITYLKFDLSAIPPGRAIFSAQLHLYAYEVSSYAPGVLPQLVIDDSWQETEITGANAPDTSYRKVLAVLIAPGDNVWDVGDDLDRSYITDGVYSVQLGYLLRDVPEYYAHFGSREHPSPSMRPYLEIEYGVPFGGGTGTSDDPYQIYTGEQMNNIGRLPTRWHQNYKLMADISLADYSGGSYNIIGISPPYTGPRLSFTGVFDGNYHSISGFSCSHSNISYVGIFGYVSDGTIRNLKLISPNLTDPGHNDMKYVGAIAGCADFANISGCSVIGGTVEGEQYVGGLVGLPKASFIADCSASASVSGGNSVGGIVGAGSTFGGTANIKDCYARGNVTGDDYVGGFIGDSSDMVIVNCYSTGPVSGTTNDANVGGFSGYNVNQFLVGDNVIGCFWDVESSGEPNSAVGTPLTTAQMYDQSTFIIAGWDFVGEMENGPSDDWAMPAGGGYPILWYELPVAPALPTFAGGSGTAGDPYLIETEAQLNSIGHNPRLMDKHFRLISDLDLSGVKYYLIADRPYVFSGMFDGADHTISNILLKPGLNLSYFGFIGSIQNGATIQDLTLVDPNIVSDWGWGVGSITGINENGTITNCHVVNANVMGLFGVGGLVGINYSYGRISGCSATGNVSENTFMSIISSPVGGLVGENTFWSEIDNSYAKCNVTGDDCVGGLVGSNLLYSILTNCYSQGSVTGSDDYIGGLIGRNQARTEVKYCYSSSMVTGPAGTDAVGGFVGRMGTSGREYYTACFWDSEINPELPGIGNGIDPNVIGESTANMQAASTFTSAGWDFVDDWKICDGTNYPKFAWQIPLLGDFVCPDGVNFLDFAVLGSAWLSDSNDSNWNPACDISDPKDDIIDKLDLSVFTENWLADM